MAKEITVTLTEKSHKHAEMMILKLANMDLCVFGRAVGDNWKSVGVPVFEDDEYYLCHPNHVKECLHWLNGGSCAVISKSYDFACLGADMSWNPLSVFMDPESVIKIKQEPEYVKVSFERSSDAVRAWEDGKLYIIEDYKYQEVETAMQALGFKDRLYRKVEKGE